MGGVSREEDWCTTSCTRSTLQQSTKTVQETISGAEGATIGQIPPPALVPEIAKLQHKKGKFSAKEKCILEFTFKENKLGVSGSNKMGIFSQNLLVVTNQKD